MKSHEMFNSISTPQGSCDAALTNRKTTVSSCIRGQLHEIYLIIKKMNYRKRIEISPNHEQFEQNRSTARQHFFCLPFRSAD